MSSLFSDHILSLFGIGRASQPVKNGIMNRMVDLVEKRVMLTILDRLTSEQQEEFLRILEIGTEEERVVFLQKHIPDFSRLIENEVEKVKHESRQFAARLATTTI